MDEDVEDTSMIKERVRSRRDESEAILSPRKGVCGVEGKIAWTICYAGRNAGE